MSPWHLLCPTFAGIALIVAVQSKMAGNAISFLTVAAVSFLTVAAVLSGLIPSPLATSTLAAAVLAFSAAPTVGAAILLLETSFVGTLQQLSAQALFFVGLESTAPALLAILCIAALKPRIAIQAMIGGTFVLVIGFAAHRLGGSPQLQMALSALPACGLGAWAATKKRHSLGGALPIGIAVALIVVSWLWTPPRSGNEVFVFTPTADETSEASFFRNYERALNFAGIAAKQVTTPEKIPPHATVLLPWLTVPSRTEIGREANELLGQLARTRKWTVILFGEHNNLGGSSERIREITGKSLLRNDLTVPPGNTDDSGPLRVLDFFDWPQASILNRGASVAAGSLWDKVLISGDGWWAERDIDEWLWVGDYVWQRGDRTGRLPLAVASDTGDARWVVVGDNSFVLNNQIYSDPRALLRVLEMATLWPAFLRDILLSLLAIAACGVSHLLAAQRLAAGFALMPASLAVVAAVYTLATRPIHWQDTYIGQAGFDQSNFNVTFADYPELFETGRVLRLDSPMSGRVNLPTGDVLLFGLVDSEADIGEAKLDGCRRLGALTSSEGPLLMDAQVCRVQGSAKVLMGTPTGAAAIATANKNQRIFVILDRAFLAQNAPVANIEWLKKELRAWREQPLPQ
ncbi:hypothetical protein J6524_25120 [Bradyrhizobium sp. WSM 1738]|uniref:hypothetical protein n=1 Tax=Bradyrhizobium hereditatis TaxID=2821405 RepID=UPI001CE341B7|nr:hypothetical protein [Bradyrhizobium hereditatis]MCA6118133.1 hypothetical protein [Bradyrhizobium hereditatis]